MNKFLSVFLASVGVLQSASLMAQTMCVVGGTGFDTQTSLFNPQLSNDEEGWFSKDLADLLEDEAKGNVFYTDQSKLKNEGFLSNKLEIPGDMITAEAWEKNSAVAIGTGKGYSAIVANPKLISPLLSEGSGDNMLVNFGTSYDSYYVMSYSISGLKPSSNVTLTCDVYNLLDLESMAVYAATTGKRSVQVCGLTYDAVINTIMGNGLSVSYSTGLNDFGHLSSPKSISIDFGEKKTLKIETKADQRGYASFYIGRTAGSNTIPMGIDNILIEGSINPKISAVRDICVGSQIVLSLDSNYPAGTTFNWKESTKGSFANTSAAFYEATEPEKTYSFTCTVSLPDGCVATSEPKEILSRTCCDDGNVPPTPLPYTDIYYEDFGEFEGDKYTYTDLKGNKVTVTATDRLGGNATHYAVGDLKTGGAAFPAITYNREIYQAPGDFFAISDISAYSDKGDNTTRGNGGGFMMIDLKEAGYLGDAFFKKEICGLCPNKNIVFSVAFAGINPGDCPSNGKTGELTLQVIDDANIKLVDEDIDIPCNSPWFEKKYDIETKSEGCVTMSIISRKDDYIDRGDGDFGIDDIRIAVCTTPNISLDYDLVGPASDLLDLCTDDILTLKTLMSSSAMSYYITPYILFQYSYDDPRTMDPEDVTWFNLGDPQQKETFTIINPADHPAFSKIKDGDKDKVYFRTVVGNLDVLNDAGNLFVDAYTPCRSVSVSAFPVVAGLNCAECKAPTERLESVSFCEGSLASEPSKTIAGFKIDWFADPDMTVAIAEPEIKDLKESETFYYVLTDMETGCAGEVTEYEVTVVKAEANPVDNSKMIVYRKSDAKAGPLKPLAQQNPSVFATALSNKEYTLMIGLVDNYTSEEPDLRTASLAEASDVMPAPTVEDITSVEDEYRWYYTYMESPEGCVSDTVLVGVVIKGAPSPITINASYCVNSDNVETFDKYAESSMEDSLGTLKFYKSDGTEIADPSTEKPDVTTAGEHIYYVSQVSSTDGGESEKKKLVIKVYDVAPATVSPASAKYCYYSGSEVIDGAFSTAATSNYVVGSDDANASWEFFKNEPALKQPTAGAASTMRPSTSEAGETSYYGRVKYKLSATETCYGAHVRYPVEVVKVPDPVVNSAITYYKNDGVNGFKSPLYQAPTAFVFDLGCTVVWYDANKSMINENDATPIYNKDLTSELETIYYVSQVNMNGCESELVEVKIIVTMNMTSLSNVTVNAVTITPNPASTKISVVAEGVVEMVEILNTVGKVVKVSDSKEINISDMHNGVYFVRATIDGETSVHRLVVNK